MKSPTPTGKLKIFSPGMLAMLGMVVCVGLGEKTAERFLPLYLLALGAGTVWVGVLNALQNLLGALYSFPGGWLSHRLGTRRALMIFTLMALAGYALVLAVPAWQAVLAGAALFIAWTAIAAPAVMGLIFRSVPPDRRILGVTLHSLVRRVPMALGPVAGGVLIARLGVTGGVRAGLALALLLGLLALWLEFRHMTDDRPAARKPVRWGGLFNPRLRVLLACDVLVRFAEQIPYAYVVVWVVERCGFTALAFGALTAVEMAVAMLVYLPVAWAADRGRKKPFVTVTFAFFTLFPLLLTFSTTWPMLVLAFVVRGLKEFGEPTRKALIMELAPEGEREMAFGAYYLVRDVLAGLSALAGAWLWTVSPAANLCTAAACGLMGTLVFALRGQDLSAPTGTPAQTR